jgi:aldehyde dehydrogenase (NAD+)
MAGRIPEILEKLHIEPVLNSGACSKNCTWRLDRQSQRRRTGESLNPATGETLARVPMAGPADYEASWTARARRFDEWRMMPAPQARRDRARDRRRVARAQGDLGALVTLEMGKILAEGRARCRR